MIKVVMLRSNPVDADPRVEKEAEALKKAGYEVEVVGWDREGNLKVIESTNFGLVKRIRIKAQFGNGLYNLPHLIRWQVALLHYLMKSKFDVIHSCDFDTVLPAIIVGRIRRKKVIYDIFDFYADMLRKTPEFIKKLIRILDYYIINKVDAVIIADVSRSKQIYGTHPKRIEVIYNTPKDVKDQYHNDVKNPTFRIGYVGLLQVERGLLEMINVVGKHPDWILEIGGYGGDENKIKQEISHFPNIVFHGKVKYSKSLEISSRATVLFATYDPKVPNHKYSSPNKLFEAMMLGKPIIISEGSTMCDIVRRYNNGIIVEYGNQQKLEEALLKLSNDPGLVEKMGKQSRKAYEGEFGWAVMEKRLIDLYSKVIEG